MWDYMIDPYTVVIVCGPLFQINCYSNATNYKYVAKICSRIIRRFLCRRADLVDLAKLPAFG